MIHARVTQLSNKSWYNVLSLQFDRSALVAWIKINAMIVPDYVFNCQSHFIEKQ